jgi:signal transduction histidine kinase
VLQDFLKANRAILIDRCHTLATIRSGLCRAPRDLPHGVPIFLDQLIDTLILEQFPAPGMSPIAERSPVLSELEGTASLHGREMLNQGFTLEQVVRSYGDVCQAVTALAFETQAPIEVAEFRTLNRCLDDAIAAAVAEYARRQTTNAAEREFRAVNARLGPLVHELRNYLQTATLVVKTIKTGNVGISGATGNVLDRSLAGMRSLIDRTLAEVKVNAGATALLQPMNVASYLGEVAASASIDAQARGCHFAVTLPDSDLLVSADPELLSSAVGNLLHNAFKFTKRNTEVRLRAHAVADRILIEVEDRCGGLPADPATVMPLNLPRSSEDRSGLGLGLQICRRCVQLNNGILSVRNLPGHGCIFTIDLPRFTDPGPTAVVVAPRS